MTTPYHDGPQGGPQPGPESGRPGDSPQQPVGNKFFQWIRSLGFYRSNDRWLGGVSGAIAYRLGWDPMIIRILWLALCLLGGSGIIAYSLLWLFLPDARNNEILIEEALFHGHTSAPFWWALILFAFSGGFNILVPLGWAGTVLVLILVGAFIAIRSGAASKCGSYGQGGNGNPYSPYASYAPYTGYTVYDTSRQDPGRPNGRGDQGKMYGSAGYAGQAPASASAGSAYQRQADQPGQSGQSSQSQTSQASGYGPTRQAGPGQGADPGRGAYSGPGSPFQDHRSYQSYRGYQAYQPYQPFQGAAARPRTIWRRKSAGPAIVSITLGLIIVSAAALAAIIYLTHMNVYNAMEVTGIYSCVVMALLGLLIVILGIRGRKSGGLIPVSLLVIMAVLATSGTAIASGLVKPDNPTLPGSVNVIASQATLGPNSFDQLKKGGLTSTASSVTINLNTWDKSHTSPCPTGHIKIHAVMSEISIQVPRKCYVQYGSIRTVATSTGEFLSDNQPKRVPSSRILTIDGSFLMSDLNASSILPREWISNTGETADWGSEDLDVD